MYYAILDADGRVTATGEGEPGAARTAEEMARVRVHATFREHQEDPDVAAFNLHRVILPRDKLRNEREKSEGAYADKRRDAQAWLTAHRVPQVIQPRRAWGALLDEDLYPFLFDEVEVTGRDPWAVARDILDASNRSIEGDMGTRAKERRRIERRERLKGYRRED